MNKSEIEQPVRLVLHKHSFCRSEPKEIQRNNLNDQNMFNAAGRTSYKPRAAIFIIK